MQSLSQQSEKELRPLTVRIPQRLYRDVKVRVAIVGQTLQEWATEAFRNHLQAGGKEPRV